MISITFYFSATNKAKVIIPPPNQRSVKDKLGMAFEVAVTNFFTEMGTLFASRPIPVIILSVGFALGLSTGIMWLNVTTDPIGELY